jgi:hypothetical protein
LEDEIMIKLKDDYAIDADKYQFILKKHRMQKSKDGQETLVWVVEGYYPTIATLIRGLSDRRLYDAVKRCEKLKAVQDDLIDWAEHLKTPLVEDLKRLIGRKE